MNRPGHCTDNAHIESFFHSLKGEWISGIKYDTVDELRKAIRTYIVHFYNKSRLHSSLNYETVNNFVYLPIIDPLLGKDRKHEQKRTRSFCT